MSASGDDRRTAKGGISAQSSSGGEDTLHSSSAPTIVFSGSGSGGLILPDDNILAGRYRIVKVLGRGGMGEVYEAEDLELHTKVALKTIRPELADHPEVLERFKREIHLARKVTHPSVCRIFDLGYHADSTGRKLSFFTMELLYGETLADRIGRLGRMTAAEALPIVEQMAAGLQAAHDEGIVHRDFKSSNVLLIPAPEGSETPFRAKITDFGLARAVERTETMFSTITGSAALVGTPAYMAPEQVEGLEITAQADIYALGVVMFEMVTGTLPFSGPSPSAVAVKRLTEPPPSPKVRVPYLDPRWDRVILGCMEKIPADRYASAMEVSTALQEGTKARRKSSRAVAGTGSRRKYIVAGVAGLILLVSAAIFALRHHYRSLPTPPASSAGEAEHYGWRRSALPGEARLPDLSAAAASDDKEITLFGASMLRTWQPGEKEMPSLQTGLVLAGNADCPWGTWLVHDDHRHLTSWNLADHRAIKTITLPWAIRAAGCLDDKQDRWLFLLHDEPPSRLIEFNVNSGQNLREMKLPASLLDMALDPARKVFMLMGENDISERSVADFGELFHDELDEGLLKGVAFQWSGSGRYFASGRRHLVIYDLQEKKRINSIAMAGWALAGWIGDDALSAMDDHGRLYWTSNIRKGWQLQQEPPAKGTYDRLLWLPEQWRWVAIDNHGTGLSWQYETPSLFDIAVSPTEIWSVAANQSGTMVAVSGKDPAIHIVDVQQPKVVRTLEGHTDGVTKVSFDSHDRLISGSDDGTLRVWDPADGKLLNTVNAHKNLINSFALSPDGEWLVSVSSDRTVKMWRMPNLDFVAEVATTRNSGAAVAFLPGENERFLVGDWAGWLYSFQRNGSDWKLQEDFHLADKVIYTICPAQKAWWATLIEGPKIGHWLIPQDNLKAAVKVGRDPGYYCASTDDGQMTALMFQNRVELRANSDGRVLSTDHSSFVAGNPVGIDLPQHMLLFGPETGHVIAWPIPK